MVVGKADLIAMVAEKSGLSKKDAGEAVTATIAAISESLVKGDKVSLVGFGSFEVKQRAARVGKNPKTKEKIEIPASKAVTWKSGQGLRKAVNEG